VALRILLILGGALAQDESGKVVVGKDMEMACHKAYDRFVELGRPSDTRIMCAAGTAKHYNDACMGALAGLCIAKFGDPKANDAFISDMVPADQFNTLAEIRALIRYLDRVADEKKEVIVELFAKDYHMPRVATTLYVEASLHSKQRIKMVKRPFDFPCSIRAGLHEAAAYMVNSWRVIAFVLGQSIGEVHRASSRLR
jgi:hypothetical protein